MTRLNYTAAAAYLGIPVGTLRSMVSRKQVPHTRLTAATTVFDAAELDAWKPTLDDRISRCLPTRGRDLYAIFCTVTRMCKIGCANDAVGRLRALQTGCPTKLILWCHAPFVGESESLVHRAFAERRAHGEWFTQEVTARIAEVVNFQDVEAWAAFAEASAQRGKRLARADRKQKEKRQRGQFEWRGRLRGP